MVDIPLQTQSLTNFALKPSSWLTMTLDPNHGWHSSLTLFVVTLALDPLQQQFASRDF